MKKYIILLITIQLLVISVLVYRIRTKQNVLGSAVVNSINKDVVEISSTSKFQYYYEPKPDSIEYEEGVVKKDVAYSINVDSLNESKNYSEKKLNVFRIITLGDSFTFGMYVPTERNWTELLEKSINNICSTEFEVINLGVKGYDIAYEIERFRLRGEKYNPDLVLWLVQEDDIMLHTEELIKKTNDYIHEAKQRGEDVDKAHSENPAHYWNLAVEDLYKNQNREQDYAYANRLLREFNDYYDKDLVVLAFEDASSEFISFLQRYADGRENTYLFAKLANLSNHELHFPHDGHPTEKGHALISENVVNYLLTQQKIPCN